MNFNLCAIVPVFRHENAVCPVLSRLASLKIFTVLVDDGNSPEARSVLQRLAGEFSNVLLVSHKKNLGKGGAVITGLREASARHFTHALQIDADGQHDAETIPLLIEEARKNPQSLVGSVPKYDASVPKARKVGRKITNFWVHVETLSLKIPDAMCGLRIYPLAETVPVLSHIRALRMGFDIEILVRLSWRGVNMRFYPVRVLYPADGISNFRMFGDNAEISLVHMRLFLGMLVRIPKILYLKIRGKCG